jgi:hypothetical protein
MGLYAAIRNTTPVTNIVNSLEGMKEVNRPEHLPESFAITYGSVRITLFGLQMERVLVQRFYQTPRAF